MIEVGLAQYLKNHAVVGPLVTDAGLTRIFPLLIPEHVRGDNRKQPCLVYQRIGTERQGTYCATDTLVTASIQIDVYSKSYFDVKTLARAVELALVDYTGPMGDTHVDKVFLNVEFDLVETDTGLYRVSQTYVIWFKSE